jgi:hypothetical protein
MGHDQAKCSSLLRDDLGLKESEGIASTYSRFVKNLNTQLRLSRLMALNLWNVHCHPFNPIDGDLNDYSDVQWSSFTSILPSFIWSPKGRGAACVCARPRN